MQGKNVLDSRNLKYSEIGRERERERNEMKQSSISPEKLGRGIREQREDKTTGEVRDMWTVIKTIASACIEVIKLANFVDHTESLGFESHSQSIQQMQ